MMADAVENSHAAAMDRMYRYQRHIYDLTRKYYLLGRDKALKEMEARPGDRVLELGCGTGRNLRLAARTFPEAKLYGLDISNEMLNSTRRGFQRDGIAPPVLVAGDASEFKADDFQVEGFERILISYALSMIPEWEKTIDCAIDALAPGGSLHIVDFGQQEALPGWFAAVLKSWLAKFHVTPRSNLQDVVQQLAERHGAHWQFHSLYRGYAWQAVISAEY
jgi:S-adenosylmethionine-diacylgycerolhomoserine-N-methlytransferase